MELSLAIMSLLVLYLCSVVAAAAGTTPPFDLQVLSSMEKVYPTVDHAARSSETAAATVALSLARGEFEAAQLVVVPTHGELNGFAVRPTGPLCSSRAACLSTDAVAVHPVGWVNQLASKVDGDRVGWIPDPLLHNRLLDLPADRRMAFLVRVHAALDVSPGVYTGTLTVSWGEASDAIHVAIEVTVWNFELPRRGHLNTCLMTTWSDPKNMWPDQSWNDHEAVVAALLKVGEIAARNRMYPCTLANGLLSWDWKGQGATHMGWPTHDCKPDNTGCLFNATRTGFLLDWLLDRGTPGVLIGLTSNMYLTKDVAERKATLAAYLSDYVPFLKTRGQLADAYLYGVDEPWGVAVTQATQTADFVKTQQPGLKFVQNTNQNNSRVIGELQGHFDVLDINLQWFDATNVSGYRADGVIPELWWNLNIWPAIHPNLYLEYPLTDARAVGPLSWLKKVRGFEYWSAFTTGGKSNCTPVANDSVYVPWGVGTDTMDGTLVYPTASGDVLSSMRLESFRDGVEEME